MSNSNNVHRRTLSSKSLKIQRPVLVRGPSSPKLQSLGRKRTTEVETTSESEDRDDMTFLQYCPTCDKQIIVPNSSILYCSESCRRKDGTYRDPMSLDNPLVSDGEDSSIAPRTIVPPRNPSTLASFASKPPVLHGFKADLDPTEWKPDSPTLGCPTITENEEGHPHHHRAKSAAFGFLSGFHSSTAAFLTGRRPTMPSRASTSALPLARTAPSTTTTTPALSAGSSTGSAESGPIRTPEHHNFASADTGLRPYGRPTAIKSVDLVKPVFSGKVLNGNAAATEEKGVKLENVDYKKKVLAPAALGGAENVAIAGSLSKLLSREVVSA